MDKKRHPLKEENTAEHPRNPPHHKRGMYASLAPYTIWEKEGGRKYIWEYECF